MVRRAAARPDRDRALALRRRQGSGADYLYTYLRTYYRDETKATGWNNLAFPNVGMPHVLWELQGQQRAVYAEEKDPHDPAKTVHVFKGFEPITPGHAERRASTTWRWPTWWPSCSGWASRQNDRVRLGVWVLLFLAVFTVIAWRLNAAFWKDSSSVRCGPADAAGRVSAVGPEAPAAFVSFSGAACGPI